MPKINPPEMGYPAKDKIINLWKNTEEVFIDRYGGENEDDSGKEHVAEDDKPLVSKLAVFAEDLRKLINEDTCISEDQWRESFSIVTNVVDTHERLKNMADNPVDLNRVIAMELQLEIGLAGLINGFNLKCENCLNEECKSRDPLVPVESVKARIKPQG